MDGIADLLRGVQQMLIIEVRVARGRLMIGMAEQSPDHGQGFPSQQSSLATQVSVRLALFRCHPRQEVGGAGRPAPSHRDRRQKCSRSPPLVQAQRVAAGGSVRLQPGSDKLGPELAGALAYGRRYDWIARDLGLSADSGVIARSIPR